MENINVDKQKLKQHHTNAAEYHKKAAENHYEAAKHHEQGNHEKGNSYAYMAYGHSKNAKDQASEACKHSASNETKK